MNESVSVVIPIYSDAAKISQTMDALALFFNTEKINGELIIVNDGGNDGGADIIESKKQIHPFIKFINRPLNRGKGYTVREGLAAANGDYVFYTDADLPYLTAPIKEMLTALKNGEAELAIANRELKKEKHLQPPWPRQITHIIYSWAVRALVPIPFTDTLAGLKGMTKKTRDVILPRLSIDRFSFDVEILLAAKKAGLKIKEIPVSLQNVGPSNLKIRRDAPQMFFDVIKIAWRNQKGLYN